MTEHNVGKTIEKIQDVTHEAVHAETAPSPVRRYRTVLFQVALVITIIAFGALTFMVKTTPSFFIDLQITRGLQTIDIPLFRSLMVMVSWAGFSPQSSIITILIALVIFASGLQWEALMALISAVFTSTINLIVKDLIQRPRPAADLVSVLEILNSYSFPSGHVMFYTGFFGFIWFLGFTLLKPSLKRSLLLVFFGGLVLLVGASRIYLGQHWASDVLGAYLLGSLSLVVTIQVYRWGKTRFFVHQPVAGSTSKKP